MPYPHAIRLAGPWEYEAARANGTIERGRIKLTDDAGNAQVKRIDGVVRWLRRFGCPTNIDAGERVWLIVESPGGGAASLNDEPLGKVPVCDAWELEVTTLLKPRNLLTIDVDAAVSNSDQARDALFAPGVRLEVRRLWHLTELNATLIQQDESTAIEVTGEVAGQPFAAGELSLLIEGFDHELHFAALSGIGVFSVQIPAARLPAARASAVTIADLNVQLLRGGEAVWESQARTRSVAEVRSHAERGNEA